MVFDSILIVTHRMMMTKHVKKETKTKSRKKSPAGIAFFKTGCIISIHHSNPIDIKTEVPLN